MIHLDGMKETHYFVCNREGVLRLQAVAMIQQRQVALLSLYLNAHRLHSRHHRCRGAVVKLTNTSGAATNILFRRAYETQRRTTLPVPRSMTHEQVSKRSASWALKLSRQRDPRSS